MITMTGMAAVVGMVVGLVSAPAVVAVIVTAMLVPVSARRSGVLIVMGHRPRSLNVRSLRLLVTTNTLDRAIAAPASIGFRSPNAASGMAAVL